MKYTTGTINTRLTKFIHRLTKEAEWHETELKRIGFVHRDSSSVSQTLAVLVDARDRLQAIDESNDVVEADINV